MNYDKKKWAALLPAAALITMAVTPIAKAADTVITRTSTITACGNLFEIDANAFGLTAEQRAKIVQKNLDDALIAARDLTPSAVRIQMQNNNPTIKLDGSYVVTADGNSAARHNLTQMQLAEKWADSIRACMADSASMKKYLSLLTGSHTKTTATVVSTREQMAVLTPDTLLPMTLTTDHEGARADVGDLVEGVISHDVPLGPTFDAYLPAGTIVKGSVVPASDYNNNTYKYPRNGLSFNFYELRTPDGKHIPINAQVLGGLNRWRNISIQPQTADCCGKAVSFNGESIVKVKVHPSNSTIVGSWKSAPNDPTTFIPAPAFAFQPDHEINITHGEPMMLHLNATSAIAIAGSSM
ncbi:MAG: hypothetical protein K2X81_17955 [Candidatus Obscuribacterales bacterium]|nr:hypothetical protein [Candidatus Obscuribacterales bacterium]